MNNKTTFAHALTQGFGTGVQLYDRQIERDAQKKRFEREMTQREMQIAIEKKRLEGAETDRRSEAERRLLADMGGELARSETQRSTAERDAWTRDPNNPTNQAHAAQAEHARAQAAATAAKPQSPIAAQVQGLSDYNEAMASLLEENEAAQAAANGGDPTAKRRLLRSSIALGNLKALGDQLLKGVKPDKPASMVKIKRSSEDGSTTEELEVPAAEWNDQHPAWGRFNPAGGGAKLGAPSEAAGYVQTMFGKTTATQAQQVAAPAPLPPASAAAAVPDEFAPRESAVRTAGPGRNVRDGAAVKANLRRQIAEIEQRMKAGAPDRSGSNKPLSDVLWNSLAIDRAALLRKLASLQ